MKTFEEYIHSIRLCVYMYIYIYSEHTKICSTRCPSAASTSSHGFLADLAAQHFTLTLVDERGFDGGVWGVNFVWLMV